MVAKENQPCNIHVHKLMKAQISLYSSMGSLVCRPHVKKESVTKRRESKRRKGDDGTLRNVIRQRRDNDK